MARTIQSPGVEIREIDFTLRPATVAGTSVFIAGFADQGPIDEVLQPGSISEFEQIYGEPTNAAEQYFYHTAKAIFNSPARLVTTRLPYGPERGDGFENWKYSALVYPVRPIANYTGLSGVNTISVNNGGTNFELTPNVIITSQPGDVILESAEATATLSLTGSIKNVQIADGGSGFTVSPTINKTAGPGQNAVFEVIIADGTITQINIINSGTGYTDDTVFTVEPDPVDIDVTLPNLNFVIGYSVSNITIAKAGAGYTLPPSITVTGGGGGTGAQFTAILGALSGEVSVDTTNTVGCEGANTYLFGKPTHLELSAEQFQDVMAGNIEWENNPTVVNKNQKFNFSNLGSAGLVVLNKAQTTVNTMFEGYYIGILDNNNYNPATPFNGILSVGSIQSSLTSINDYLTIPRARLNFALSATKFGDGSSVSEVMENLSQYDLNSNNFDDTISLGVFKLRKSIYTSDTIALDYILTESHVGSLDYHRQIGDQTGGPAKTFYVGELANNSSNIRVIVNPYISNRNLNTWVGLDGNPTKKVRFLSNQLKTKFNTPGFTDTSTSFAKRVGATEAVVTQAFNDLGSTDSLFTLGVYSNRSLDNKHIGSLVKKLERGFELVENYDVYQINLAAEAGLGTIYVNAINQTSNIVESDSAGGYNDSLPLLSLSSLYVTNYDIDSDEALAIRGRYSAVADVFINAAERQRKDFMVILDPLKNIFVQGSRQKVITSKKLYGPNAGISDEPNAPGFSTTNFSQHIYWPLRHQFGTLNTSYATTYATWVQVVDGVSNKQIWVPFSGFAAALMANTDSNFQPWFAPAGFTRGVVVGANDIGVYPKLKQRDQLYKISINPVTFFPAEGFVVFGQKTLLKKPSAFDRINVRRLFLNLEVAVRDTMKYFIFEPNTLFTRTQVVNTLSPIFDLAKNTDGVYDYLIVCDERNNTPDVIDNNELKVDIYIKPVRTAEFILVSFYATRTNQNFQELVGGV